MVIRQPSGMWRSSAAQHSQSLESWYAHIPGLVVAVPSTPADNAGLLKAALRCDDPVVYMEHKSLWPLEGEVPDNDEVVPLGKARCVLAAMEQRMSPLGFGWKDVTATQLYTVFDIHAHFAEEYVRRGATAGGLT